MKSIDFSKPGGFPLTQDQLGYLQSAWNEGFSALLTPLNGNAGYGNVGQIISGMALSRALVTGAIYNYTIGIGWFFLNGELIRMIGTSSPVSIDESIDAAYVQVTRTSTPLTYNNGSTSNVVNDVYGTLVSQAIGTSNSTTLFLYATTEKYGRENGEGHIVVNTPAADGGVGGDIYYRKNFLNNTLQLRGVLGAVNAQNFVTSSTIQAYLLGTLPLEYSPVSYRAYFAGEIKFILSTRFKDDLGINWLERIVLVLIPTGEIYAYFIKPDISVAGYPLEFNVILPLD